MKKKLLVFHFTIAPYRIDFFNDLSLHFQARICLKSRNLSTQKFDYSKIESQFLFAPVYLKKLCSFMDRVINVGYWKHLQNFCPDIVIVGEFGWDACICLFHRFLTRRNYRIISICDDSYDMIVKGNDFSKIHRFLRSYLVPKLDNVILVEPNVANWFKRKFRKGIFFPIVKNDTKAELEYELCLPLSRRTISEYGLQHKCVFLFVGRLIKIKNVDFLIRAYSKIATDKTALVIVGSGNEEDSLHELAKTLNVNVIFTGRLEGESLFQWYNIAHCFVLPSVLEPFGAVTNEALLAGCIGLISNKAGSQCLIKDGKNGYTFDPENINDLISKMKIVVNNFDVDINNCDNLRKSRMLCTYNEMFAELLKKIE